jgi:hypothetical protein
MPGKLASGADQRPHLGTALHHVGLIQIVGLRTQHRVEVRHDRGRRGRERLGLFDEDHRIVGVRVPFGKFDGQVPGGNTIALFENCGPIDALAVYHGAVLAAQVFNLPGIAIAGQSQVLPRQSGVVGITKLVRARPAQRDAVAIERNHHVLAIDVADYQFAGRHLRQEASVTFLASIHKPLYSDEAYEDGPFYRARHRSGKFRCVLVP